jgi:hypothetical protein
MLRKRPQGPPSPYPSKSKRERFDTARDGVSFSPDDAYREWAKKRRAEGREYARKKQLGDWMNDALHGHKMGIFPNNPDEAWGSVVNSGPKPVDRAAASAIARRMKNRAKKLPESSR